MYAIREYYRFIFPNKYYSGDYYFVYASDDNNVVGLLQPTPYISNIPEADIPDEYVVDTMGSDMMDKTERENVQIYNDYDSRRVEEHEMDYYTYYISDAVEKNRKDKIYM